MADSGGVDDPATERRMMFAFETVGDDHFRLAPVPSGLLRLYGGQVVAQALAAIQRTAPAERPVHSCHAYFVSAGDSSRPTDFFVSRDRDGRSFSARRVSVEQDGKLILSMAASLHAIEDGQRHQLAMPEVAAPETLLPMEAYIAEYGDTLPRRHWPFWRREQMIDWRPVEPFRIMNGTPLPPQRHFWLRLKATLGDDPAEHQRFLAYASDLHILHAGLLPLGIGWADSYLETASLDHAIWFHDRFRVDDWLLYALDSPAAGAARALGQGNLFTRDGRLVATVAQQGLIRIRADARDDRL